MAISIASFSVTMTDAEFLKINGVPAPAIPASSPFFNRGVSASSTAGITTVALTQTGARDNGALMRLLSTLRRSAQVHSLQFSVQ